jgi:hypothetical protein
VYGRQYDNQVLTFEASGGLIHNALVMQDRETNSYWAIMAGGAIAGKKYGTKLNQLPFGEKMRWKDWLKKHPDTLVLSVNGKEDAPDTYRGYFVSPQGYRGAFAKDNRLRTKEPVFAFVLNGAKYAVPAKILKNGKTFDLGEAKIFLYRPKKAKMYTSTVAFYANGSGFKLVNKTWIDVDSNCIFNTETLDFEGNSSQCPQRLTGFDTFWYTWSLTNPDTEVLE